MKYDLNSPQLPERRLDPPDDYPADEEQFEQSENALEDVEHLVLSMKTVIAERDWDSVLAHCSDLIDLIEDIEDFAFFASRKVEPE